jgi:hypothetical protein
MALSKVGTSANVQAYGKSAGGTISVVFTADSTFAENDFLVFFLSTGAKSAGSTYTHLPGTGTVNTATSPGGTWTVGTWQNSEVFFQNSPYWGAVYYFVTGADAGSATITVTVTLGTVSSVGAGTGWMFAQGGVAVRGAASLSNRFVPPDNTDTDNVVETAGASPQTATWPSVAAYYAPTAGTLLLYGTSPDGFATAATASSTVWTGPTEIDDDFSLNLMPTNVDMWQSSAYELLSTSAAYPADHFVQTWAGGASQFTFGFRGIFSLNGAVSVSPDYLYPYERRHLSVKALPYHLTTGITDGVDA